jgi:hypothetical protein
MAVINRRNSKSLPGAANLSVRHTTGRSVVWDGGYVRFQNADIKALVAAFLPWEER